MKHVMVKKLSYDSKVLAVFNRDANSEAVIKVDWGEFNECCAMDVFDVWRQKDPRYIS